MPTAKPIQIFKPGRHTALSGQAIEFSAADLAASAAAYDPTKSEAPIVVGHPALDAPAYGWVKSLAFADGALDAQPDQVDAAFAEMVAAGRFKKISASFFLPDAANNPVPGVYYLRHVGFLGAAAPAVKGLRNPSFAADEAGVVEFGDWDDQTNASLWRGLRDWLLGKFGQDEADKALPSYAVASLEANAAQTETETNPAPAAMSYAEENQVTPEQKAALEAENATLKAQLAEGQTRARALAQADRHTAHAAFAEGLAAEGKLLPAQQLVAVATLDFMGDQADTVSFGEGDAQKPLADAFKEFLAGLPKQVDFSDIATRDKAGSAATAVEFAAPAGFSIDGAGAAIHRAALIYQSQHNTDYLTAVRAVSN